MSNTLYYKFGGLGKILWNRSACVTHLYSENRWKYCDPFKDSETLESVNRNSFDSSLDNLQWIEYRIKGSRDDKYYYHFREVLRHSRMKPHLKFLKKDYSVRYRFTKDTPRAQVIFIVSNMRYWEENLPFVKQFINGDGKQMEDPDLWLAAFSSRHLPMSGHAVYKPFDRLRGLKHYIDDYVAAMIKGDQIKLTMSETTTGQHGYPAAVTKKFLGKVEDTGVPYAGYGDYGEAQSMKDIIKHFSSTTYKLPKEAA